MKGRKWLIWGLKRSNKDNEPLKPGILPNNSKGGRTGGKRILHKYCGKNSFPDLSEAREKQGRN